MDFLREGLLTAHPVVVGVVIAVIAVGALIYLVRRTR